MRKRFRLKLLALVPATVLTAGLAMFMIGSAGPAVASQGTCSPAGQANCTTTASVQIAGQTTITDSTSSISFTAPVSLPGEATSQPTVSLLVSSNDAAGYTVSVLATPTSAGTVTGTSAGPTGFTGSGGNLSTIPFAVSGSDTGLQVLGSESTLGTQAFTAQQENSGGNLVNYYGVAAVDKTSAPSGGSGDAITDTYSLYIPNVVPDTYKAYLSYSVTGN
jgi:hypothetical protein